MGSGVYSSDLSTATARQYSASLRAVERKCKCNATPPGRSARSACLALCGPGGAALHNPAAAENEIAGVEDRALSRRDRALGFIEHDLDARGIGGGVQRRRRARVLIANLHIRPHRRIDTPDRNPIH